MAPATGAEESRAHGARADRARREARGRAERRAERSDDVSPLAPHEAARQPRCVTTGDRGVERAVGPLIGASHDAEVAEQVPHTVAGVDQAPGTDRERAGESRIRAGR